MKQPQYSWDEWRAKAAKEYKKGVYTAQDMVRDWGYPKGIDPDKYRLLFDKGNPYKKDREKINTGKRASSRKRNAKETTSTNLAAAERKSQDQQFKQTLDEASLFALNDKELAMMIEHGVSINTFDNVDSNFASGDPSNRYLQPVTEGIKKTDFEKYLIDQGLDKQYTILDDEITGGRRVVDNKFANTFQFPSEQGVAVNSIDDLKASLATPHLGRPSRKAAIADILKARATRAAGKLIPGLDLAISAAEVASYAQMGRFDQAALAGLSGIIGFVPGGGDLIAAGIDGYNGVLDVKRYDGTSAGGASFANAFDSLRTNKIRGRSGAAKGA